MPASRQFDKGYVGNIEVLFRHGLPVALGLNITQRWLVPVVFPIACRRDPSSSAPSGFAARRSQPWFLCLVVMTFPMLWAFLSA